MDDNNKNMELLNDQISKLLDLTQSIKNKAKVEQDFLISNSNEERSLTPSDLDKVGDLAKDIIKLRDQILIAKYNCEESQKRILTSIYEEIGRILKVNGIESLENEKFFNSQYHNIIEVRKTNIKELHNTIADTCRPGYKFKGKVIRALEVILYRYDDVI